MTTKEQIFAASVLGTAAFKKGLKGVPVLDKDLREFLTIENCQTLIVLKSWSKAWHLANLNN